MSKSSESESSMVLIFSSIYSVQIMRIFVAIKDKKFDEMGFIICLLLITIAVNFCILILRNRRYYKTAMPPFRERRRSLLSRRRTRLNVGTNRQKRHRNR